jgi:hypothetical protein
VPYFSGHKIPPGYFLRNRQVVFIIIAPRTNPYKCGLEKDHGPPRAALCETIQDGYEQKRHSGNLFGRMAEDDVNVNFFGVRKFLINKYSKRQFIWTIEVCFLIDNIIVF